MQFCASRVGTDNYSGAISLYAIFGNPIVEELFWRGVVLNELERAKFPIRHFGMIWSSILYAALHLPIVLLVVGPGIGLGCVLFLAVYGAILAAIYRLTGSIVLAVLTHGLLTDVAAVVLMLRLLSEAGTNP